MRLVLVGVTMSKADALKTEQGDLLVEDTADPGSKPGSLPRGPHPVTEDGERAGDLESISGERLGRYLVLEKLGRGGMGTVFHAHDEIVDRPIALKLLHSGTASRHALRLRREAQAMAQLSHPNIVRVYEVGKGLGRWFIAMELVEGQTLGQWQRGDHDWRARVGAYLQAGEGLAAAHRAGFVHRDFKPDNCLIDEDGRVRVLDFGLVRDTGSSLVDDSAFSDTDHGEDDGGVVSLTQTGAVLGTVAYMSLEQLSGNPVDARSDQFAFCVSLYEALYGMRPFAGEAVGRLTMSLMNSAVRAAPKGTPVPDRVRQIVLRGLLVDPNARWPSMQALLAALRRSTAPQRRRTLVAAGGIGTVLLVGAGLWLRPDVTPCSDAGAQLDGIWDRDRRAEIGAAFEDTTLSYAPETWTRVEQLLDERAEAWEAKHVEICEATHERAEQSPAVMDLRMRCLQERRVELQETVDVLAQANAKRVQGAVELVSGMPDPSVCDDVEALQAQQPPPEDPRTAREVLRLRERLTLIRSLETATEYDHALAEAEVVDQLARTLGYAPLEAEARYRLGSLRADKGLYARAEKDLEQAYLLAVENDHDDVAIDAVLRLIHVAAQQQEDSERALFWSNTARARIGRVDDAPKAYSAWLLATGAVLSKQGKPAEALEHYERALSVRESSGARPMAIATTLGRLADGLMDLGRHDESLDYYRRALEIWKRELGNRHPRIAKVLNGIGVVLLEKGQLDEALDHYSRARDLWIDALGERHPQVGNIVANIGNVLQSLGKYDEALEQFELALSIWEESLGPEHPRVGRLLSNIGGLLGSGGEYARSLRYQRRAASIMEANLGAEHPDLAQALGNIGVTLWRQGELDEAVGVLKKAHGIAEKALGPEHTDVAQPLVVLAEIALERGDPKAAQEHTERALAILRANDGVVHEVAYANFLMARALWPSPESRERAIAAAKEASVVYARLGEPGKAEAARIEAWIENDGVDPEPEPEQ